MRTALLVSVLVNLALGYHLYQSHMHLLEHIAEAEPNETQGEAASAAILMLGDSITAQGEWATVLGRDDVANRGIPGYTTGQLIWTIKNGLWDHPESEIWFLQGGINDLSLGISADRVYDNYLTSVDSLQRNNKVPVVQSVILQEHGEAVNATITQLNERLQAFCAANGITYVDLNAVLAPEGRLRSDLTTDGTHLTPGAYALWGERVRQTLTQLGYAAP
ncbi:MAG: hypothetical protein RhofKO_02130 [Rhodothermales bacterium]